SVGLSGYFPCRLPSLHRDPREKLVHDRAKFIRTLLVREMTRPAYDGGLHILEVAPQVLGSGRINHTVSTSPDNQSGNIGNSGKPRFQLLHVLVPAADDFDGMLEPSGHY